MNGFDTEQGPYAPPTNVLTLIQKQRSIGLAEVLNNPLLLRLGMPEGNLPRIVQAMKFLGLIDDDGRQTDMFQRIRRASTEDYPGLLAQVLKSAYEPIFSIVDPATATDIQLSDAFRKYEPQGQRTRMVTLFLGLCREAELVTEGPVVRKSPPRKLQAKQSVTKSVTNGSNQKKTGSGDEGHEAAKSSGNRGDCSSGISVNHQYQLLLALLNALPAEGQWTQQRRDKWLQAFSANVDLLVEVADTEEHKEPQQQLPL